MKKKRGKVRPPPIKRKKVAEPEVNERMPMCRICEHRHSGVSHIWK